MDTYENNSQENYYIASEVAEILGLDKNTILHRCKKGFYPGAIKTDPSPGSPHGIWLIPKSLIDKPFAIQDVATLTRQLTPVDLERIVGQANLPLLEEIAELKNEQTKTQEQLTTLLNKFNEVEAKLAQSQTEQQKQTSAIYRKTDELVNEIQNERKNQGFFAKLFGK